MMYYDLWDDPAGLGSDKDWLTIGDVFFYDGKDWLIVDVDMVNNRYTIEEEKLPYDD